MQIKHASADDPVLQILREVIQQEWPKKKADVPPAIWAYYDVCDEITIQDQFVFKGPRVVIPAVLRKEIMSRIHASHIGIEGCIWRACDSLYWPQMNLDFKEYISKCKICLTHTAVLEREPLLQHEIPEWPWARIGLELFKLKGRTLLVVCGYYSSFIEVEKVHKATTHGVSKVLKCVFLIYGVPDTLSWVTLAAH